MTVGGRDQVVCEPLGADVVKIIGDSVRRKGFIPVALGYESARSDGHQRKSQQELRGVHGARA